MVNRNCLPNVFVIGAAKCGTTALVDYLFQHPDVYQGYEKECHFFNDDEAFECGTEAYIREFFNKSDSFAIRIDGTPGYLRDGSKVIPRIKQVYGNEELKQLKFIVMLRDPLDRAYSHYRHMCRLNLENQSFSEAIKREDERLGSKFKGSNWWGYYKDSQYVCQLDEWVNEFESNNIKIIRQKDLLSNPQSEIDGLCEFLGLKKFSIVPLESNGEAKPKYNFIAKLINSDFLGKRTLKRIFGKFLARRIRVGINRFNQVPVVKNAKDSEKKDSISDLDGETLEKFDHEKKLLYKRYGVEL